MSVDYSNELLKQKWGRKKKGIEFLIIFILLMSFPILAGGYETYFYDGNYYFYAGDPVFSDGFNLYGFQVTFRGYLLPVIISFCKLLFTPIFGANSWVSYSVFSSFLTALTITILLPYLFELKSSLRTFAGEIVTTLILLFFWGDFLQYPLADLPALVFMVAGIALLKYICNTPIAYPKRILLGIVDGMLFYASYSAKVTFKYGVILALIWVLVYYRKKEIVLPLFPSMALGALVMGIPQMLLNGHAVGIYTPEVITALFESGSSSLEMHQILVGISEIRLESYIGNHAYWSGDNILFHDIAGSTICSVREGITAETFTFLEFFQLFLKYPLDFIAIYTRHLISLMTPLYSEVYVNDLYISKGINVIISFVIWFLTGLSLWTQFDGQCRKHLTAKNTLFFSLLIPPALTIVGVSEVRFFLPVYVLSYFAISCCVDWKSVLIKLHPYAIRISLLFLACLCLWVGVVSSILMNAGGEVFLINDSSKEFIPEEELYSLEEFYIPDTEGNIVVQDFTAVLKTKLQNGVSYRLSFETDSETEPEVLYFDLYGTNFDLGDYDFLFDWKTGKQRYEWVFTCTGMPDDAIMRLVQLTNAEYKLRNIKFESGTIGHP